MLLHTSSLRNSTLSSITRALTVLILASVLFLAPLQAAEINGNLVVHGSFNFCDAAGSTGDTYVCALPHNPLAYHANTRYSFLASASNLGAATLNLNGLGAKTLKRQVGGALVDLVDNDIRAGEFVEVIYDGTFLVLVPAQGTQTVASGTVALATVAIATETCATAQTATATGTLSTDSILASFNGDVSAVTGYAPVVTGTLRVDVWPTANTVNLKVCNGTGASVTPGAASLNWRVVR
jgi:hypothetical protein